MSRWVNFSGLSESMPCYNTKHKWVFVLKCKTVQNNKETSNTFSASVHLKLYYRRKIRLSRECLFSRTACVIPLKLIKFPYKNAFHEDAYRPLIDHISSYPMQAPPATNTHTPLQPCTPPSNHACPPATMHTPQQPCMPPSNHAWPPGNHAHPPATTHAPRQPRMPPPRGQTDTCKNITFANFVCGR